MARRRPAASCGDQSAASLTSPSSETHSASTPSGSSECGMPGATLTHRGASQQLGHEVPRRRPAVHVEHPSPRRTTGGVGEDHPEARDVDVLGRRDLHRPAETQGVEVGAGHLHPELVAVDPRDGQPGPRQCHQVAADAAAEVQHGAPAAGCTIATRAARCVATRARVACSRPSGVKYIRAASSPSFAHGPHPQVDLGQRRCRVGRVEARCRDAGRWRSAPVSPAWSTYRCGGPDQQRLAGLGEQPAEGVEVHASHPVRRRSRRGRGRLALVGDEC